MSILTGYDKFIQQALKYGFSLWGTAKTGQTISYRAGDDGDFEKGYPKAGVRFVDNGDGTITDNATGLMWVKEPGAIGGVWGTPGNPSKMNWDNCIDRSIALTYAGHSDWRLPNLKELLSIADLSRTSPAIDPTFFPSTQSTGYWTSDTLTPAVVLKFMITFSTPGITIPHFTTTAYLRPVRLGVPQD